MSAMPQACHNSNPYALALAHLGCYCRHMPANRYALSLLDKAVAAEVAAEIKRQRRTVTGVAESVEASRSHFSRQVNGRAPFRLADLDAVSAVLNLSTSELIERAEREIERVALTGAA